MKIRRILILMRHGTAVSGSLASSDHERTLTPWGCQEALDTGRQLAQRNLVPGAVFVSDASRTCETWWSMESELRGAPAQIISALYGGGRREISALAKRIDPKVTCVLMLGHNPGWSNAASWLTHEPVSLRPANAAILIGETVEWADLLGEGAATLQDVILPVSRPQP
ncbi:MAG: hypothetical protein GWP91_05605 [Rhodobacterales bacterium]|nr:hypothetical protein [Rhodobacterales bacterium]